MKKLVLAIAIIGGLYIPVAATHASATRTAVHMAFNGARQSATHSQTAVRAGAITPASRASVGAHLRAHQTGTQLRVPNANFSPAVISPNGCTDANNNPIACDFPISAAGADNLTFNSFHATKYVNLNFTSGYFEY